MLGKIFNFGKKKLKLVTHDGNFHTDDIFTTAALSILFEKRGDHFEVVRTRDPKIIASADYVYDVGGVYNEVNNRFDHHQTGGAGERSDGIPYSSFGLVWKKFGEEIAGGVDAKERIEERLVEPIDSMDNGKELVDTKYDIYPYTIQHFFESAMLPTWREDINDLDKNFFSSVEIAKKILTREIIHTQDKLSAKTKVLEYYQNTKDKRLIVLNESLPFGEFLSALPEPLFVVSKRKADGSWSVVALRQEGKNFENKKDLPKAWAGLMDQELQKVTGVTDAIFCHRGLFLAVAKSKEGAVALAQKALKATS